ncbi:MAG: hypothetical protein M3Y54_22070 [Bacteroidota bacterium]|nr:hypothetical protein [Bacteroidota bacterium]
MRYCYLKTIALLLSSTAPTLAQNLPANVQTRAHGWYLSPGIILLQTQRFESNNTLLQSAANDPLPALGLRLGYSHSPAWALETGFHVLPNNRGFVASAELTGYPRTYKNSGLYLPVALVLRVWQPTPRLAVRAVVGGGLYLQNGYDNSFTDTVRYALLPSGSGNNKLLVRKQGATHNVGYAGELGLRAEWQAWPTVFIGAEAKDLLAVSGLDSNLISVTDVDSRALLATAYMASRRHTLGAGITVRVVIQHNTSYRYQPVE